MPRAPRQPPEVPAKFQPVVRAFEGRAGVTLGPGWGAGNLVLKHGAKIFVMMIGADLVAKLPRPRVDQLVESGTGVRFDPRHDGRVMKEWLVVSPGRARLWAGLADEAFAFAASAAARR
jgi:hypothetical protein